jgi:hypothetical protein
MAGIVLLSAIPWVRRQAVFSPLVAISALAIAFLLVYGAHRKSLRIRREKAPEPLVGERPSRLRLVLVGGLVFASVLLIVPHFVVSSCGAYELAIQTARMRSDLEDTSGKPVSEGWFSGGTISFGNPAKADLSIPERGRERNGTLHARAIKNNGEWRLLELTLEVDETGVRTDLLAR